MNQPTTMRPWAAADVAWGDTLCDAPSCITPAQGLWEYDEERDEGVPVCIPHADRLLERVMAMEVAIRGIQLPDVFGREPYKRPPARLSDAELWNRSPELWALENGWRGDTWDPDWDIPF